MHLASAPAGALTAEHFTIVDADVPELAPGQVLVQNSWLSIDPSIRIRLGSNAPAGYLPPLRAGDPLAGLALGVVVESRSPDFSVGDLVSHMHGYRDYAIADAGAEGALGGAGALTRIETGGLEPQWFLGPLGSSGLTAYVGLFEILDLTPDDTLWVSAAAGAVGNIAVQLARLRGARVVASAGGADKVHHLATDLGADRAFDYRSGDLRTLLSEAAPDGIDAYFDNVGGDHLAAALDVLRENGRVAICGAVSTYDRSSPLPGPSNLFQITAKSLRLQGFRAGSFNHLSAEIHTEIGQHLADGTMYHQESVYHGLDQAPAALVAMLNGHTRGKTLCRLD